MEKESLLPLIYNASLLISLILIYTLKPSTLKRWPSRINEIILGLSLGVIGILIMLTPWELAPGFFFDTRSVLLSISGLYFGFIPTFIAMIMAATVRLIENGGGVWVGTALVFTSGFIGILWRKKRHGALENISKIELFLFGLVVHVIMIISMLFLPSWDIAFNVITHIALPTLVIFPLVVTLLGSFLSNILRSQGALSERLKNEFFFQSQFNLSNIGITITSPNKSWLRVNPYLTQMLGYSESELKKLTWGALTHPEDLEKDLNKFNEMMSGEIDRYELDKRFIHKDGSIIYTHLTVSCYRNEDEIDFIIATLLDITDRKQAEESLQKSEATVRNKLKVLLEPDGDISSLELSDIINVDILQSLMDDFYELTGMLGAVLDIKGNILVAVGWQDICTQFHRCHPDTRKNCIESDTALTLGVEPGEFKAYHCKNNMWDMVTPLIVGGKHVGNVFLGQFFYKGEVPNTELFRKQAKAYGFDEQKYLSALNKVPRFSKEEVQQGMRFYAKLAEVISSLSFSSIKQARLLSEREEKEKILKKSFEGTIQSIAMAVEVRDPYTAGHQMRVADIAVLIATEMGLESFVIEGIRWGAMIHDIGKINIPAEILSKPTRLTDIEYTLIKEHAQVGYNIMKSVDFPWPIANIAHQHHERIDGSGYPQGLKGDEICLEARIVAVADVVEAIASHRPYRPALGIDVAMNEIKSKRGTFFDPAVVDACIKVYDSGKIVLTY